METEADTEKREKGRKKIKKGSKAKYKREIKWKRTVKIKEFSTEPFPKCTQKGTNIHAPPRPDINHMMITCIKNSKYDNRRYVTVMFNLGLPFFKYEKICNSTMIVAVKDVAGIHRFVRTFTFEEPQLMIFNHNNFLTVIHHIDRYIPRETLLNDRDVLLPNDILTLKIEVSFQLILLSEHSTDIESTINNSSQMVGSDRPRIVLNLNSKLAKRLYEVSTVFRDMYDNSITECTTVNLNGDAEDAFRNCSRIILGAKSIAFNYFEEIVRLYIFADKYDIQKVIQVCRNIYKRILQNQKWLCSVDLTKKNIKLLKHLNFFDNIDLEEIIERFLEKEKEGILDFEKRWEIINQTRDEESKIWYEDKIWKDQWMNFDLEEENGEREKYNFYG